MRQAKYISNRTFRQPQSPQPTPRKRNNSLGTAPTSERPTKKQEYIFLPVVSYRRHRLQSKIQKFKSLKANTKQCQENMNNYNNLKKEVTKKVVTQMEQPHQKYPKLFIRIIRNLAVEKEIKRREFKPQVRRRSKTEGYVTVVQKKRTDRPYQINREINSDRAGYSLHDLIPIKQPILSPKKYNQLSLEEIVGKQTNGRYSMFIKLGEMVGRKGRERVVRKVSDDYSLQGWEDNPQLVVQ